MNKCNPEIWVKYEDELHPWLLGRDLAPVWGVEIKQNGYTKRKWGDLEFRSNTCGYITCNGDPVYKIRAGSLHYAMAKAQTLIVELTDHIFDFVNPESMIGHKVWYENCPAIVSGFFQGNVTLDFEEEPDLSSDDDWVKDWNEEIKHDGSVKDDVLSPRIRW